MYQLAGRRRTRPERHLLRLAFRCVLKRSALMLRPTAIGSFAGDAQASGIGSSCHVTSRGRRGSDDRQNGFPRSSARQLYPEQHREIYRMCRRQPFGAPSSKPDCPKILPGRRRDKKSFLALAGSGCCSASQWRRAQAVSDLRSCETVVGAGHFVFNHQRRCPTAAATWLFAAIRFRDRV
jgi:hypothetical protein